MNRILSFLLLAALGWNSAALASTLTQFIGDENFTTQIFELNHRAGTEGKPLHQPWSGSYWPLHSGSVADPYNEKLGAWLNNTTRKLFSFKKNQRHYTKRIAALREKVESLDDKTLENLAPSEKYDLFIGDHDFTFTRSVWQGLSEQNDFIGHISLWEGTCHGWSTAAINEPRPEKAIRVMSLDGKYLIPFYPDDLKALATLLWGNSLIQDHTVMAGSRCQAKKPLFDRANGKVLNETCQGVSPADFHVAVLELVGARKESFVINRQNNTQVWNQPIASYELSYFNPITGKEEKDLQKAIVGRTEYPSDPFFKYRDKNAVWIVGVNMMLHYTAETNAGHQKTNSDKADRVKRMKLHYDLELDANYRIIGGEWRGAENLDANDGTDDEVNIPKYPGFIWKFATNTPVAYSVADHDLPSENPTQVDFTSVVHASKIASQFRYTVYRYKPDGTRSIYRQELRPQPLGKVVHYLIGLAH